jgi:hypothetical protein
VSESLDLRAVEARLHSQMRAWEDEGWPSEDHADMIALLAALRETREALRWAASLDATRSDPEGPNYRDWREHAASVFATVRDEP